MAIKRDIHSVQDNAYGDGFGWTRGPLLGEGGFGRVYKATPRYGNGSPFAVKSAEMSRSSTLRNEKEIITHLNIKSSRYVITCYGDETTVGNSPAGGVMAYNLLLEYASGGTLSDRINKTAGSGLPEVEVREHTRSILKGLHHVHNLGYVHCDMKPDNILLVPNNTDHGTSTTSEFRAKIGDFGLAKRGKQQQQQLSSMIISTNKKRKIMAPDSWRGTPMYLSPEAVICNEQEAESDVWAVGCIVLKMLTGKSAWEGKNTHDILTKIRTQGELPSIPNEIISEDAKDFLMCCFQRNPVHRLTADLLLEHPFVLGLGDVVDDDCSGDYDDFVEEELEDWDESSCERSVEPVEDKVTVQVSSTKYYWVWPTTDKYPIASTNVPAVNLMRSLMAR